MITPPESAHALESALATHPALTSLPSPKPEILSPKDLEQTTGTGELLRLPEAQKAITSDFVVLPCDLISELDGSRMIQQWLTLHPATGEKGHKKKGGLGLFYPTHGLEGISNKKDETDFIATVPIRNPTVPPPTGSLRPHIEELVTSMPTDTLKDKVEEDKDKMFKIRHSLINKHSKVKLKTKHRDAHFYVFPRWVKDFAMLNENFDSISEDVLGWWAKAGWQDGLSSKLRLDEVLAENKTMDGSTDDLDANDDEDDQATLSTTSPLPPPRVPQPTPTFATRVSSAPALQPKKPSLRPPPLLAYIQPSPAATLIRRVDTTPTLLSLSLHLAKAAPASSPLAHDHKIHPTAHLGLQSRVSNEDTLIAENVNIGSRANIKECVIGANATVAPMARLTRCLLMEGAYVGAGAVLTGCVVGRRARVEGFKVEEGGSGEGGSGEATAAAGGAKKKKKSGDEEEERTKLTDCEVAPSFVVEAGTVAKGDKFMGFGEEELEGEFDEDDGGDEDSERESRIQM